MLAKTDDSLTIMVVGLRGVCREHVGTGRLDELALRIWRAEEDGSP